MCDALSKDAMVERIVAQFGLEGYGAWMATLELYGQACDVGPVDRCGEWVKIDCSKFRKSLKISAQKLENFFTFFQESPGKFDEIDRFFWRKVDDFYEIKIPEMKTLRDEYSKKKKRNVRTDAGASPKNIPPKNTEEDTNVSSTEEQICDPARTPDTAHTQNFEFFIEYAAKLDAGTDWVPEVMAAVMARPVVPPDDVLRDLWRKVIDYCAAHGIKASEYVWKAFVNRIERWEPKPTVHSQSKAARREHIDQILRAHREGRPLWCQMWGWCQAEDLTLSAAIPDNPGAAQQDGFYRGDDSAWVMPFSAWRLQQVIQGGVAS